MTRRRSWKMSEQRIAEQLGGRRTPLSGEGSGHDTSADVLDVPEYVEAKLMPESGAWTDLRDLAEKAKRRDRRPLILYDDPNGERWWALWFEDYTTPEEDDPDRPYQRAYIPHRLPEASRNGWLVRHRASHRLPHAALVEDTVEKANDEAREPLVVIQKKRSPRQVALVPVPEGRNRES